jgi:hypothetical protein
MKEKTFRLMEPFQGEKNLLEIEYNRTKIELPCIPQVHFPLQMSLLTEIGPIPRAFFVASEEDIPRAKNASTIKVKITHLDFEPSIELLKSTLSQTDAKIRIDANRTLSLAEVKILASIVPKERLDFFEEPTKNIEEVLELDIPLAIDESFLEKGWENRLEYQQVVAAVVKPYRVFYEPIYNLSKKLGKRFILSSSLEDSTPILKLATYLGLYDEPIGIDVDRFKAQVAPCPIKKADPTSIAIITQTERISYQELDRRINTTSIEEKEVLSKLPKLEAVVRFFALLRQGKSVSFHSPQKKGEAKTLDSIPLETCITLISSGTTGSPKEIVWKWGELCTNILDQFSSYPRFRGASYRGNLNLSRIGGLMACLRPLLSGGTLIFDEKSYADYENMVPTQIVKKFASKEKWNCGSLLIGGAPCPLYILEKLRSLSIEPVVIYTTSELGTCLIANQLITNAKVRIQNGSLQIKKLGVSQNAILNEAGYFETHDLAFEENGQFFISGRGDRVIHSGGEKILLDYIEKEASRLFDKALFFAFGFDDPYWGQALGLAYLADEDSETIRTRLKGSLPYYMIPKVLFLLPKDAPEKPPLSYLQAQAEKLMVPSTF